VELYSLTQRGIDVITLSQIADSIRFSDDMINDNDMEFAVKTSQKQYMLMRPLAKTRGNINLQNSATGSEPVNIN
jgi:hypothetical protein